MGKNSRARRDARRRAHPQRPRTAPPASDRRSPVGHHLLGQSELIALIEIATRYVSVSPRAATAKIAELNDLAATAPVPGLDPAALVVDEVLSRLRAAWEYGWQPADLVHATRRQTSAPIAKWMGRAVLVEAERTGALDRAPEPWADQLRELGSRHEQRGGPDALLPPGGRATQAQWVLALGAVDFLHRIPRSERIVPAPSEWGRQRRTTPTAPRAAGSRDHDEKTLTRIRALLAKAESTEFDAEAEAFTAKAQDLMTRHAIDEALLADEAGQSVDVRAVRVLIHQPYAVEKAGLLDVVGRANRTRAVWNDFAASMTIVGVPTDLEQVEMLFTSLLVQATRAMTQAGSAPGAGSGDRSTGFRKAFLSAYAVRIGERLTASAEAATATYGTALVPVLRRQTEAVEGEFERLFPHITQGRRRTTVDARGWDAGTRAADDAVIPGGAVEA